MNERRALVKIIGSTVASVFFFDSTKANDTQNRNKSESSDKSQDVSRHKQQKRDVEIVNNGQLEHEIEIIVTEQNSPNNQKASRKVTLGGRNEPSGPSKPNRAKIDQLDFNGGKTHELSVLIDGIHRGSGFVVTNSEGMGPLVSLHIVIDQFDNVRVNTVA